MAADELVIIQAVSTTKHTFAIRRGYLDGVGRGQESLFTNKNVSFAAIATDVNRNFSVWEITDLRGKVPFEKGDFVTFTNSIENVWTEIPKIKLNTKQLGYKPINYWMTRFNLTMALSESVGEVESSRSSQRQGFQAEVFFQRKFEYNMEWALGLRMDRETSTLKDPAVDAFTQRLMVATEFIYHFQNFKRSDNNMYIGLGGAYGVSSTTVDDDTLSGTAMAFPVVRLGYLNQFTAEYAFLFELVGESISQEEAFEGGSTQSTNVVNSKFSFGIKF